jgi:hypothetical protein
VDLTGPRLKEEEKYIQMANIVRLNNSYETDMMLGSISDELVPERFIQKAIASVNVHPMGMNTIKAKYERYCTVSEVASITPEHMARTWNIGVEMAKETLKVTTQKGQRYATNPIQRRYKDYHHLHAKRLHEQFYVDHLVAWNKSLTGNTGSFVYTNGKLKSRKYEESQRSWEVIDPVGRRRWSSEPTKSGPGRGVYWLEVGLSEMSRQVKDKDVLGREEDRKESPKRLWDYGLTWQSEIM